MLTDTECLKLKTRIREVLDSNCLVRDVWNSEIESDINAVFIGWDGTTVSIVLSVFSDDYCPIARLYKPKGEENIETFINDIITMITSLITIQKYKIL